MSARAYSETQRPRHQCSSGTAQRYNGGVPHKYVRGLEIRAMQLQHSHAGKTRKCACYQSRRNTIHREAAPEHQPTQQRGGDGMEEARE